MNDVVIPIKKVKKHYVTYNLIEIIDYKKRGSDELRLAEIFLTEEIAWLKKEIKMIQYPQHLINRLWYLNECLNKIKKAKKQ